MINENGTIVNEYGTIINEYDIMIKTTDHHKVAPSFKRTRFSPPHLSIKSRVVWFTQ